MTLADNRQPETRQRLAVVACFATMFMVGMSISLLGPSLPGLAATTKIPLAQAGLFFTFFSAGSVSATLIVARLMDRPIRHLLVIAGSLVMGTAQWLVARSATFADAGFAIALTGLAMSTAGTAPNAIIADRYRERAGQALNALHLCLGCGAFVGPLLVGEAIRRGGDHTVTFRLAGSLMLLIGLLWVLSRPPQPRRDARTPATPATHVLRALSVLLLFAALYTGTEQAFGGWIFSYARVATGMSATDASALTSLFWLAILVGRLTAVPVLRRLGNLGVLLVGVSFGAPGLAMVLAGSRFPALAWAGVALVGLGFGPAFPTALAVSAGRAGGRAGMASSLVVAAGSVGAMVLPWAAGAVTPHLGLRASMAALFIPLAAMLACLFAIKRSD